MTKRVIQVGLLLMVAACGTAPSSPANAAIRGVSSTEVARFESPWAMDFLPGSGVRMTTNALVTERGGRLWLIDTKDGARQQVAGVPPVKVAGQGGLGDVVAHPNFAANQQVYLSFVEAGPNGTSGAAVGYGRLILGQGPARLDGFRVIWRQDPKVAGDGHFSHRIAFVPDGAMFVTSGDREKFDPAQSLTGNLGKVLRLTAEGQPMPGNPYASRGGIAAQFWSIGHRNLLGIAV